MRKFLILAFLAWTSPSFAQLVDGNRALKECDAEDKSTIQYFIAGVIDAAANDKSAVLTKSLQYSVNTSPVPKELTKGILTEMHSFCLAQPVDLEQMTGVICSYLKSNPKLRNASAALLAVQALQSAYPCKPG